MRVLKVNLIVVVLSILLIVAATGQAAVVHDESVNGDLSTDPAAPTSVVFAVGSNQVKGTMVSPQDTRDYLTFTIPVGSTLAALRLLVYEALPGNGPGNRGYHALNSGATSLVPSATNSGSFLGGDHLDAVASGTDLLPVLANAPLAGTGFTVPLGPGTYSYLVQQTGPDLTGYSLEFAVTGTPPVVSVPAVAPLGLLLLGLLLSAASIIAVIRARYRRR